MPTASAGRSSRARFKLRAPPSSPRIRRLPRLVSVGRLFRPPRPDQLERLPESRLGRLLVERGVDVGAVEHFDRRGGALYGAERGLELIGERELDLVHEAKRLLAHDNEQPRLNDV